VSARNKYRTEHSYNSHQQFVERLAIAAVRSQLILHQSSMLENQHGNGERELIDKNTIKNKKKNQN
jgi:hypothetical protein